MRPAMNDRVLFINRSYWPDAEATGQLLTELCQDLAEDFAVSVLAGQPNQNPDRVAFRRQGRELRAGVEIRRVRHTQFRKTSLVGRTLNILSYLFMTTLSALCGPRPDVVVVETDPPLLCLLGWILRLRFGCPLVVYLQDLYPDLAVALGRVRSNWAIRLLRRMMFGVYRRADRVVVLSRDMRQVLIDSGVPAERIACIPNWVDTSLIRPLKQDNPLRRQWNPDERFLVVYSGNMGLCQGLEDVVRAAELLAGESRILFLLIGDGASRPRLEEQVRTQGLKNLQFLPYQSKSELAASLSAADVHLVPVDSRVYNYLMPSKLYGVLASGTPLVAVTPAPSELADLTAEAEVGLVVAPGDPPALAEAVRWCADHPTALAAMGVRARRLAENHYDRHQITRQFAGLLATLTGRPVAAAVPCVAHPTLP